MTRGASWLAALLLALVAGVGAGLWAGDGTRAPGVDLPPSDRVDEAVAGWRTDPFYIAPEMRHVLTEEQRNSVSAELRRAPFPIYLVYLHESAEGGYYIEPYLIDRAARELGDGLYVIVNETMDVTQRDIGMDVDYVRGDDFKARPAQALHGLAMALASAEVRDRDDSRSDYWGGPWGGLAAGALFAAGISLVIALVLGVVGLVRRSAGGAR